MKLISITLLFSLSLLTNISIADEVEKIDQNSVFIVGDKTQAKFALQTSMIKRQTATEKKYIVIYKKPSTSSSQKRAVGSLLREKIIDSEVLLNGRIAIFTSNVNLNTKQFAATDHNILAIEEDQLISIDGLPNDSAFNHQWAHQNTGQDNGTQYADMQTPLAWQTHTGSREVVIGIIDTGIDFNHDDLKNNLWINTNEVPGDGYDNDQNGYIDDIHGINAITQSGKPMDDHQHGTHIAGIIGAQGNNRIGTSGINWKVSLASCKFLDKNGRGYLSNAIRCINYFVNLKRYYGVNIVALNNSWGGSGYSQALLNAIQYAAAYDILFVAAAGNKHNNNDKKPSYPANYDVNNVLTVASSDRNDLLSHFSNYGKSSVHMAAPGSGIYSTFPNNQYGWISGTSMSTAQVSGAVALSKAVNPNLTSAELKEIVIKSGDLISDFEFFTKSSKRLNVARAVDYAIEDTYFDVRSLNGSGIIVAGETAILNFSVDTLKGWNGHLALTIESDLVGATVYSANLLPDGLFLPTDRSDNESKLFESDRLKVLVPTTGLTEPGTYSVNITIQNGIFTDHISADIQILPQGMSTLEQTNNQNTPITDKSPSGVYSDIEVSATGFLTDASLSIDITHPFIKDLEVALISPDNVKHLLHNREGGSSDDIVKTYSLGSLNHVKINGVWRLFVADHGKGDIGTLNQWTLSLKSVENLTPTLTNDVNVAIPDNTPTGMLNGFFFAEHLDAEQVKIPLHIVHPFIGDLDVTLVSPSGTELSLHNRAGGGKDDIQQVFDTGAFSGEDSFGLWQLKVVDSGRDDQGILKSWSVQVEGSENQIKASNQSRLDIPDHNDQGSFNSVEITALGLVNSAVIAIDVTHPYRGDLVLTLIAPSGKEFMLHNRSGGSSDDINQSLNLEQVLNESVNGHWKLKAVDKGRGDVGHVNSWSLTIQKQ